MPSATKLCLICGIEYQKGGKVEDIRVCPACGTLEEEHIQFEYVVQHRPYEEANYIPNYADNGCGVAKAFNGDQAQCVKCPFDEKCLLELHHTWKYYALYRKTIRRIFRLADKEVDSQEINRRTGMCVSSINECIKDRYLIEPIYEKLKDLDLTEIDGPKE